MTSTKIPTSLTLRDWSASLDYQQVTETLNLVFFYKKEPGKIPKKYYKSLNSWLKEENLSKFVKYKEDAERHQLLLSKFQFFNKELKDQ